MAESHTSDRATERVERGSSPSERLRDVTFPLAVRGYDRRAVDEFMAQLRMVVADLESRQTREGVVQKALDEIGEETAGILQRAHEAADEITARSRAQADGRLQRAEREAEMLRRDAEEYSAQVVVDTRRLWEDRLRLLEDIRQLADEVLATADDAMERVKMPEPLAEEDELEPTTSEDAAPGPIADAGPSPPGVRGPERAAGNSRPGRVVEEPPGPVGDDESTLHEIPARDVPPDDPEAGHTVELEALPGGGEEDPLPESERD